MAWGARYAHSDSEATQLYSRFNEVMIKPELFDATREFEMYRSSREGVGSEWESVLYMSRVAKSGPSAGARALGLAHRVVVVGGVLDGVVVGRDGADPGRERRPVQEEALVLLLLGRGAVDLALDKIEGLSARHPIV